MVNKTKSFRKGNLVKLNIAACFTEMNHDAGGRDYPLSNWHDDDSGIVYGRRPSTDKETEAWYASDAAKGMTSAGETKLPPQSVSVRLHKDDVFTVLKGRARVRLGWGNAKGGFVKVERADGETAFVPRELLTHA